MPKSELTQDELLRYSRHLILPEFGEAGQLKLKSASVLVVGAGGLGSPLSMYLAAAGIGRIGLIDDDVVDETNLQRQILYGSNDLGKPKVDQAKKRLSDLNPLIQIDVYSERLTSKNALKVISDYNVVADGTDNFATRYLVNDACILLNKINVHASIYRFEAQVSVFGIKNQPCYRCLYPNPPPAELTPSCAEGGVLGILPGIAGSLQATEVIKVICGIGKPLAGRLLMFDALSSEMNSINFPQDTNCPVCGDHPTITELIDYDQFCNISTEPEPVLKISVQELNGLLSGDNPPVLLDVRRRNERLVSHIGGTFIPVDELADRIVELSSNKDKLIVVYCRSGRRSTRAVRMLQDAGFSNVKNLSAGLRAWKKHIHPELKLA